MKEQRIGKNTQKIYKSQKMYCQYQNQKQGLNTDEYV